MPALRDASELLWPAVAETIASLDLKSEDAAAVKLAQRYARVIDQTPDAKQPSIMRWLGPELHRLLESLGATPAARAAMTKGGKTGNAPEDPLEALRKARGRSA